MIRENGNFGFDTESSGPNLVDRKKGSDFINMYRASLTGCSFYFESEGAFYVPINHTQGNAPVRAVSALMEDLQATKARIPIHNVKHELLALRGHADLHDHKLVDTMIILWLLNRWSDNPKSPYGLKDLVKTYLGYQMSSFEDTTKGRSFSELDPTNPDTIRYACEDAWAAYKLDEKFYPELSKYPGMEDTFWSLEMPFVRVLRHIEDTGMSIDRERLERLAEEAEEAINNLLPEWEFISGGRSISSSKQLQWFYEEGHWPTAGVDFKKKSGQWSTESEFIESHLENCKPGSIGHVAAELRLKYMEYGKILSTYTHSLIRIADQYPDGRLHSSLLHTGAATGRLSSSYPNIQNIPTRTDFGKKVLEAFIAEEGWELSNADYSQIELRVLAHLARGGTLFEAYTRGEDVHAKTAESVGVDRHQGKTLNFAVIYGAQEKKLGRMLGVPSHKAKRFIKRMWDVNPELVEMRKAVIQTARERGYIRTLMGRIRRLDNINSGNDFLRWKDERRAFNTPIQGGARDVMTRAMVNIYYRLRRENLLDSIQMCAQVHDDNLLRNTIESGEYARQILKEEMENAVVLRVPLVVDPGHGRTWKDLK